MINQELSDYIRHQLQTGTSREEIEHALRANNWTEDDIRQAFITAHVSVAHGNDAVGVLNVGASLPGPIKLLKESWEIYKSRFWTFIAIFLVPFLITLIITSGVGISTTFAILLLKSSAPGLPMLFIILSAIAMVAGVIIIIGWSNLALLYAIKDKDEPISFKEAYRRGWKKLVSWWWISLLTGFIVLGGLISGIIPGIIFSIWFSLSLYILISEDLRGMDALMKSKEYVRGRWWGVFGRIICVQILFFIIALICQGLVSVNSILGNVISYIASIGMGPLALVYLFVVYEHLKNIKGPTVQPKSKKGLFIFFGILGILAPVLFSLLLVSLGSARVVVRDARRTADINLIRTGLLIYYDDHNTYPTSLNELSSPAYLQMGTPTDPKTNQPYEYMAQPDGKDYLICTQLEKKGQKCHTSIQ